MASAKEQKFVKKLIKAQEERLPNLIVPLQPEPHIPSDDSKSPKPSKRWKDQVKKKKELELQKGPLNEASSEFPERRLQLSDEDKEEWGEWLNAVKSEKVVKGKFANSRSMICEHCKDYLRPTEMEINEKHIYKVGQLFNCKCGKSNIWCNSLRDPEDFISSASAANAVHADYNWDLDYSDPAHQDVKQQNT